MPLASGARIGGYEITRLLGSGGMGEVYRAHDSRLNRDVAIKVLLPAIANDAERLGRFAREAQVLASLNHSNIAHIYGLEPSDPDAAPGVVRALVMELVEGPTLADRLTKGALPVDEALEIATQVAEALEAAHDHGVIHRDLKPANIKVREDGTVKVLDFGLAKAVDPAAASTSGMTQSPTMTTPAMTEAGIILGTAAYMSPEQAKGRAVDKRSDLWAFSAVLYEMLTGSRPFDGEDTTDVLGAVVRLEPDWSRLPADTPAAVRSLVQGCLVKDRRHRVGDMAAALFVLRAGTTLSSAPSLHPASPSRRMWRVAAMSAVTGAAVAGIIAASLVGTGVLGRGEALAEMPVRFTIAPPDGVVLGWPSISPDGRRIVVEGSDRSLWVRALDQAAMQRLPGTEGAVQPFWSPDSRSIGFFAGGKLKKMDLAGGTPVTLCDTGTSPAGASWGPDGVILFAPAVLSSPIHRVSAAGGASVAVTTLDSSPGAFGHADPHFLPDGRHFLYRQGQMSAGAITIRVGSLDGSVDTAIGAPGDSNAEYTAPGTLMFARGTTLLQQPFDAAKLVTTGDPTPVAEGVRIFAGNSAAFAVSHTGTVVYMSLPPQDRRQVAWVDRQGAVTPLPLAPAVYGDPSLSPDGRQIALAMTDTTGTHIWVYDLERGTLGKRTFQGHNAFPLWSRDGQRLVFSTANNRGPLMTVPADGSGQPESLIPDDQRPGIKVATSWSTDGRLVFQSDADLFVRNPDGALQPVVATAASEREGRLSPTGTWLAYSSNENGPREVYVQSFPTGRGKRQISRDGGAQPMWSRDGRELFYTSGNRMMAVPVEAGATFEPGPARVLFEIPLPERSAGDPGRYAVSPDSKRFMVLTTVPGDRASQPSMNVILNWPALAKATAAP